MKTLIHNYHTHTWRCQHARGTEEQFVQTAIELGFETLGFSDHTPWPYRSGYVSNMRMRLDQFAGYKETVLGLRARYGDRIRLPLGLECEAFPDYFGWLRDFKAEHLDYVILGNHNDYSDERDHEKFWPEGGYYFGRCDTPEAVIRYGERTMAGMATGLYDYVAHPDLCFHTYPRFDDECRAVSRDLCQCAVDMDLPLEFNLLGFSRHETEPGLGWLSYPCEDFWHVAAETGCKAIIGFDAHEAGFLARMDLYDRARATIEGLGMALVQALPIDI